MIVQCPFCGFKEAVPEEYAGMTGECGRCRRTYVVARPQDEIGPVPSFLLGFLFSILGVLIVAFVSKKTVAKAILGAVVSSICVFLLCFVASYYGRAVGKRTAGATAALSAEEGWKAKEAAERISASTVKELGE